MSLPPFTQCMSLRWSHHVCNCVHAWGLTAPLSGNQHPVHGGITACLPPCHAFARLTAMHVLLCAMLKFAQLTLAHCRPTQCKCQPPCTTHMLPSMQYVGPWVTAQ